MTTICVAFGGSLGAATGCASCAVPPAGVRGAARMILSSEFGTAGRKEDSNCRNVFPDFRSRRCPGFSGSTIGCHVLARSLHRKWTIFLEWTHILCISSCCGRLHFLRPAASWGCLCSGGALRAAAGCASCTLPPAEVVVSRQKSFSGKNSGQKNVRNAAHSMASSFSRSAGRKVTLY